LPPLTKSQINKLGERLRKEEPISTEALDQLQTFRALHDAPLINAQLRIREELRIDASPRLKTIGTIVEKLRREKTRLSEMQDIAGLRIVRSMSWNAQSNYVHKIEALFPDARTIDRRRKPSHGYRAVHVITRVDGYLVEIQVRSVLQNLWAQTMERLADTWGRGIRYGDVPRSHAADVGELLDISKSIASIEEIQRTINQLKRLGDLDRADIDLLSRRNRQLKERRRQIRARLDDIVIRLVT